MVFSSIIFLYFFVPALIIVYVITPKKLKNLVMFLASMVFYAWGEIRFIPVMLTLSLIDYTCGRQIDKNENNPRKRTVFMMIDLCSNLFVLLFFKYANFFVGNLNLIPGVDIPLPNIILPIGVSFNSFQSMSYILDVYRKRTTSEKSYYNYLTYTTLFPQIIAGPIVRYVTVEDDLENRDLRIDNIALGLRRFLVGLGKKVLIGNNLGSLWEMVKLETVNEPSVVLYWIGILAFSFQIYYDFSGYSDMAIGLAKIFGFDFSDENFNYPYVSKSITEFWRRWHMTLGNWFRDYVYIPLGGNKKGKIIQLRNIIIVWALTGFWHGASWNFIAWGLYFAIFLIFEKFFLLKFFEKLPSIAGRIYTWFIVLIGWVIFEAPDIGRYLQGMFGMLDIPLFSRQTAFYILEHGFIFIIAIIFSMPTAKIISEKYLNYKKNIVQVAVSVSYLVILLACTAYLVNSTYNPFLYFRF